MASPTHRPAHPTATPAAAPAPEKVIDGVTITATRRINAASAGVEYIVRGSRRREVDGVECVAMYPVPEDGDGPLEARMEIAAKCVAKKVNNDYNV